MRSKEVEEAINILDEYIVGSVSKPIVDYIEELEKENELYKLTIGEPPVYESEIILKDTLRKINTNTDTYRDFTEEVLKLL